MPIEPWLPTNEAVRWSSLEVMTTEDVENWTEMWSKAENVFPVPKDPGDVAPPPVLPVPSYQQRFHHLRSAHY